MCCGHKFEAPRSFEQQWNGVADSKTWVRSETMLFLRHSVMSDSLWPSGLQHARLPCPSPSPRVWLMSIESVMLSYHIYHLILCRPLLLLPSVFPGSFPVSQLFASGDQSIGASAPASVLPMNIQGCFPLGLTGLISLLSQGLWRVFSSTTVWKHQFFGSQPSLWSNSYICTWLLEKP